MFGLGIGLLVAYFSYQWVSDPHKREQRAEQERVVLASRRVLQDTLQLSALEIVDPLAPQRKVGKVYIYPLPDGWEVSGYYRRNDDDRWHPYLMGLDNGLVLRSLKIQDRDAALGELASRNAALEVTR